MVSCLWSCFVRPVRLSGPTFLNIEGSELRVLSELRILSELCIVNIPDTSGDSSSVPFRPTFSALHLLAEWCLLSELCIVNTPNTYGDVSSAQSVRPTCLNIQDSKLCRIFFPNCSENPWCWCPSHPRYLWIRFVRAVLRIVHYVYYCNYAYYRTQKRTHTGCPRKTVNLHWFCKVVREKCRVYTGFARLSAKHIVFTTFFTRFFANSVVSMLVLQGCRENMLLY